MQTRRIWSRKNLTTSALLAAATTAAGFAVGFSTAQAQEASPTTAPAPVAAGEPTEAPRPVVPTTNPQPGALMEQAANSGSQVYVDDSFASIEKLRTAARLATQGQSQLAITAYQNIIDSYGQKLVYLNNDSYVSITDYVRAKLMQLPAVQSGMYDQLFGMQAKKEIDAATDTRDLAELIRACDQYFPSSDAFNGLSQAAEWHFERGEFAPASRIWRQLLTHPTVGQKRAELLFRIALAEGLNGNKDEARSFRDRLSNDFPDATGSIDGADVKLLTKLDEVLALPPWTAAADAKDEWPAFAGGPTRSNLLNVTASIGAQLWTSDLDAGPHANPGRIDATVRVNGRIMPRQMRQTGMVIEPALNSFPVLSAGTLLIHTGDRVIALSANAGTFEWAYPEQSTRGTSLPNPGEGLPFVPPAHDSVSVMDDRVFAILPAAHSGNTPTGDDEVEDTGIMGGNRLVALNREDGRQLWATPSRSIKLDNKGVPSFVGAPIVTRQGVFAMARKIGEGSFNQLYLVRLDPDTGTPTWCCYLCSTSAGIYYGAGQDFGNIPIPTLVDDVLYVATGQGATCAVDANVGRILWLQMSAAKKKTPADYYNPQITPAWKFNPPLVHRNTLVAYECGSEENSISIYDRWTGKLIRSLTPKDLAAPSIDVMAGIVDANLILMSSNVSAFNLDKIDQKIIPAWTCEFPPSNETGKAQGRPFLTTTGLYVPFEKGMALIDVKAGKVSDFWQWPKTLKDVSGKPGNVLVTSEQVVVVSQSDISGYSRWETARDNRLAQIAAHPADPAPYLALAEISFRTSHMDLAQENMKRSVELATGSHEDAAGDARERLYRTNLNFAEQLLAKPDAALRDQARFYYEQCKATARSPEQQAEWRLSLSDLSLAQSKPEEAATLYNEVLADASMRIAPFHRGQELSRAGVTAEQKFRTLREKSGPSVYQRFEDQAAALLATAQPTHDPAIMQQVIDAYPNSAAAVASAKQLAAVHRDKQEWLAELKVLLWVYPRVAADQKGAVIADLAETELALKRFTAALAWTERGQRQFKDFSWTDPATKQPTTFAKLHDQLRAGNVALSDGRRPLLPPPQPDSNGRLLLGPAMDENSATASFATGTLLVPLEQSALLNRPDKLFVSSQRGLQIFDTATKDAPAPSLIPLPQSAGNALLGSVGDITVLAQPHSAIGVNTRTHAVEWQVALDPPPTDSQPAPPPTAANGNQIRIIRRFGGGRIVVQAAGRVVINGNVAQMDGNLDELGTRTSGGSPDPEANRQFAFSHLPGARFSTMRIINDKLLIVANGSVSAFDVATGKPKWVDSAGAPTWIKLPAGSSNLVTGNDDLIVAEIDSLDRGSTTFFVLDAETGKFRKQINLSDEHVQWRSVGDDGQLYAVTDQSVVAYDLFSDQDSPLWRRSDIQSHFPAATILALDGLILVNANSELMCLSKDGGEVRWPTPASGPIRLNIPDPAFLRATLDGDIVIYQSVQGILAYYTDPQESNDDQVAWIGSITQGQTPPLDSFQVSDPYVVLLASGPAAGGVQRSVRLILLNRKGGRIHSIKNIQHTANADDPEGPAITAWQVVDNGIAMQVGNVVHFYHAKTQ